MDDSYYSEIARIIQYNQQIRQIVQDQTKNLLDLKSHLIQILEQQKIVSNPIVEYSGTLFDTTEIECLNQHVTKSKIHLALVGTNSCGKTSFLHFLLKSSNFLPTDVGPVSARIVRLTYSEAEHAALIVYPNLNNRTIEKQIDLSRFFLDKQQPDWQGMKTEVKPYVNRPDSLDATAFSHWATRFVQIQIPSPFLKLGIDVYDTPGLLFSDAPILKTNLCQLVESIQPTMVFLYDDAAVPQDTKDCFLAMKDAIGQLKKISMFFLNTKADIDRIVDDADPNQLGIDDEQIPEVIFREREKRYQLLLNVPQFISQSSTDLPKSIAHCPFFDIISVHSEHDEFGARLNQTTINRLIEYTANSDLKLATEVSRLVLPMIDAFFDLISTSTHRTKQQFQTILNEAKQWTENYYQQFRTITEDLLVQLHSQIFYRLEKKSDDIARRASKYQTTHLIENYIKTTIQQEIFQVEINKIKIKFTNIEYFNQFASQCRWNIAERNEFLLAAQRNSNWLLDYPNKIFDKKLIQQTFARETVLAQILLITDVLIESKDKKSQGLSNYQQLFARKSSLREDLNAFDFAQQRLDELSTWLDNQKVYINEIIDACYVAEKNAFLKKINQFHNLAERSIQEREQLHNLIKKYETDFARIQCRINAALNLAKFNGQPPVLEKPLSEIERNVFTLENEYFVKKTSDYLEGHYHLRLCQLKIPNILPLLSLSVDEKTNELYLYFPKFDQRLKDVKLTVQNLFEISYDLANTLGYLHLYEIQHEPIKIENIFLDTNNQCYLSNFHWQREQISTVNGDIHAFGQIAEYLYDKIAEFNYDDVTDPDLVDLGKYKTLFLQCLSSDLRSRPKIVSILQQIKDIRQDL